MDLKNMITDFFREKSNILRLIKEDNFEYVVVYYILDENCLSVYHLCGYEEKPNETDINNLLFELENDVDFQIEKNIIDNMNYFIYNIKDYDNA